jgi:indole-3-glycerol phosphate synthase
MAARLCGSEDPVSVLERILAQKRLEVGASSAPGAAGVPKLPPRESLDAVGALTRSGGPLRLIAEVKFRSPSAGVLSRELDAAARAVAYAQEGARMVSVLCDTEFFEGGFGDLARARKALDERGLSVPLLAKEFVIDALQLEWAAQYGADAALLIARIVTPEALGTLAARARALGLEPFVEVVSEAERDLALQMGARIVGMNARDLDTLAIDLERAAQVLAGIPPGCVAVHLSGLGSPSSVAAVAKGRADAALVGEALMRASDPAPLLRNLVSAAGGR